MAAEAVALFAYLEHFTVGLIVIGWGLHRGIDLRREIRENRTSGLRSKRTIHGRRRRD